MAELKDNNPKLTEDDTVRLLMDRLNEEGWTIESHREACIAQICLPTRPAEIS